MSFGQNYKFNLSSLNNIYLRNTDEDFSSISIAKYKYNGTLIGPFNGTNGFNGTWCEQNDINYKINGVSITGIIAKYFQQSTYGTYTISVPTGCIQLRVILIGAGGSGGVGGGDDTGKKGTDGAGGGGGGVWVGRINVVVGESYSIRVGKGGAGASGSRDGGGTNYGSNGNSGEDSNIYENSTKKGFANGGSGGPGGNKDAYSGDGPGGANNTINAEYSNGGGTATNVYGASSGYITYYTSRETNNIYPRINNGATYGVGGNGTQGDSNVPAGSTQPGTDGYARVYFMF